MNEKVMEQVREIIELVKKNDLNELTLKTEGLDINIKNQKESLRLPLQEGVSQTLSCASQDTESDKYIFIHSPLVGTFYRSPSPSSPVFVETGEEIEPRQTLCIIEAMKVMNEIVSEKRGRIVEFLVENGEIVDFGRALLKLELLEDASS